MNAITLARTIRLSPTPAVTLRLLFAMLRLWSAAVRYAERPGRSVPYC